MLRSLAHLVFANLLAISGASAQVANAQVGSDPPATAVVSPSADHTSTTAVANKAASITEDAGADRSEGYADTTIQPGELSPEASIVADPVALLPDLPPVPRVKTTLVGGTIEKLDRVRDQITLSVFGGGRQKILFDPRTRIYDSGKETSAAELKEGQRVYLDTILDGNTVFARNIRFRTISAINEGQGVVVRYRVDRGELAMRDAISPNSVRVRVNASTRLLQGDRALPISSLAAGSLISVKFSPEGNGREVAREISILAMPGVDYTFTGQVVHIDLRAGLIVINSSTDHKTYEVYLNPYHTPEDNLQIGSLVTVTTRLEDSRYVAHNLAITSQ